MIVFEGELSRESTEFLRKRENKIKLAVAAIALFFVASSVLDTIFIAWYFCVGIVVNSAILIYVIFPRKNIAMRAPNKMTLQDNKIYLRSNERGGMREMFDVKKVLDFGAFYYFVFKLGKKSIYYICQKDLIVEGTIEEFEKLFEGKIERSQKNKTNTENDNEKD